MSGILDEIDDTLADWHGSTDSMRWKPEREFPPEAAARVTALCINLQATLTPAFQRLAEQMRTVLENLKPVLAILAEPRPSALDDRYRRRQINRRRRRK